MNDPKPIKIVWHRLAGLPEHCDLASALSTSDHETLVRKIESSRHPAFCLRDGVFLELPPIEYTHGDLLVYLSRQGWLVRRNYVDRWYVDIGILRPVALEQYAWTDLWLDLTCSGANTDYRVLDVEEFAAALKEKRISDSLAAYALQCLGALIASVEAGTFPPPEVREAEKWADSHPSR